MKKWLGILIVLVIIALVSAGTVFWWIPFRELSKGQLAIIGDAGSGPNIYLLNPLDRSWRHLPTDHMFPRHIAWSPDGKKIAFTYSTNNAIAAGLNPIVGVAILNLEDTETKKVYLAPAAEQTNGVAWTSDGQSLVFDVLALGFSDRYYETALQMLDIQTGKLQSIPIPENTRLRYLSADHLEIAQNNDYVMGNGSGSFTVSPDLKDYHQISDALNGFFLTPDRKDVTIICAARTLCSYDLNTNLLTETYHVNFPDYGSFSDGNWSYDEKDVVYLMQGGIGDPQYIMLLDTASQQNYTVYKYDYPGEGLVLVWQLAWHSVK